MGARGSRDGDGDRDMVIGHWTSELGQGGIWNWGTFRLVFPSLNPMYCRSESVGRPQQRKSEAEGGGKRS